MNRSRRRFLGTLCVGVLGGEKTERKDVHDANGLVDGNEKFIVCWADGSGRSGVSGIKRK